MMGLNLKLPKINTGPFHFGEAEPARSRPVAPFDRVLPSVTPNYHWQWAHLAYIGKQLDRVTNHEINRLMIFCPPQHGKSSLVTIRYPVWRLERDQHLRVIVAAYNQTRANEFSRDARRIAAERFALHPERSAVEEWQTMAGGGPRRGGVRCRASG